MKIPEDQKRELSPVILLVEDSEEDVMLIKAAFNRIAPEVQICVVMDGPDAMYYLKGIGYFGDRVLFPLPVLMLMDSKLPTLSGIEVLRWLKTESEFKQLPVVIFSSLASPESMQLALQWGADRYKVKPDLQSELLDFVKELSEYWNGRHPVVRNAASPPC
jgi:CheY-like chemotaxis protein